MAYATHAPRMGASEPSWTPKITKPFVAPTPLPNSDSPLQGRAEPARKLPRLDSAVAHAAAHEKRRQWASLHLRQSWADEAFMRGHLKAAGLQVRHNGEPATVARLKTKLRAVGIHGPEIQDAIGLPLRSFLQVNPGLPLWAALALVLESTGRYADKGVP